MWNLKFTLPHSHFNDSPYSIIWCDFFVTSENVQVEKGFATKGAHQHHSSVDFPNMGTNGGREVDGPSLQPSTKHL